MCVMNWCLIPERTTSEPTRPVHPVTIIFMLASPGYIQKRDAISNLQKLRCLKGGNSRQETRHAGSWAVICDYQRY